MPGLNRAAARRRGLFSEEGAGLVETAFAISVFLMLLFAIFDFSLACYAYHYVSDAAREGSRFAIVRGSDCSTYSSTTPCPAAASDIASYVQNFGYPGIDTTQMAVNVQTCKPTTTTDSNGNPVTSWPTCSSGTTYNDPGDQVQVTVSYPFLVSVPFWKSESLTISSQSSMVISQ
jgi:Flp pilus assembly protein TadG